MSIFDRKLSEKEVYSDIDINFIPNWDRDLSIRQNARAVSQSLVNIITTAKGSMPFDPDYGTNINSELFKNLTPFMLDTIIGEIETTIRRYEPRVGFLNVEMLPSTVNKNTLEVKISFSTKYDMNERHNLSFEMSKNF